MLSELATFGILVAIVVGMSLIALGAAAACVWMDKHCADYEAIPDV